MTTFFRFFLVLACLGASVAFADDLIGADVAGRSDHPLLKRMAGSVLVAGDSKAFDEFVLALSRVEFDYGTQAIKPWEKRSVEGARSTNYYRMQKDVTTVEALRSYENDLTAQGFTTLWKGKGEELDNGFGRFIAEVYQHSKVNSMMEYIFPGASDYRYLAMHRKGDDGSEQFMAGFFAIVSSGWSSKYAAEGDCLARIDLIEVKAIENRMVTVKAEEMGEQLKAGGRVALYGILFDSNRAEVKPESSETLAEVSKYLQSDPTAKILVVGHTDSVGGFESNRDLSERRARAVVEYLVSKHQIDRERLFSFGVSYASPVASNEAEAGRAKNRRVELVRY